MDIILITISVILVIMFFLSGLNKLKDFDKVSSGYQNQVKKTMNVNLHPTLCKFCIICAILIEIIAPILIVFAVVTKNKTVGIAASVTLIVFTILATLIYHFPPVNSTYYPFISNVTTIGGLALLAYTFNKF